MGFGLGDGSAELGSGEPVDLDLEPAFSEVRAQKALEGSAGGQWAQALGIDAEVEGLASGEVALWQASGGLSDAGMGAGTTEEGWSHVLGERVTGPASIQAGTVGRTGGDVGIEGMEGGQVLGTVGRVAANDGSEPVG